MSTRRAAAAAALALLALLASPSGGEPYDVKAYVWVRLTVANNSTLAQPLPPLAVELPSNGTYQLSRLANATVRVSGAPAPCRLEVAGGECGSAYLVALCSAQLPPRGTAELEVVSEVLARRFRAPPINESASGTLSDIPRELAEFTRSEGPWTYEDARARYIVEAARRVVGGERRVLSIVAKLVDWIWGKVDYEVGPGPRYPWETLPPQALEAGRGKGDCDDQANLLILALRSLGVPAYLETALVADFNYREERVVWAP
ncbi:MAG: transglutaminase-like domain-containing protein, partial [Thermofilum sp.]|nr:transglutaminase-like domain-containing protein [Thermofilum sp.]